MDSGDDGEPEGDALARTEHVVWMRLALIMDMAPIGS